MVTGSYTGTRVEYGQQVGGLPSLWYWDSYPGGPSPIPRGRDA
jgi:hypothetical protein